MKLTMVIGLVLMLSGGPAVAQSGAGFSAKSASSAIRPAAPSGGGASSAKVAGRAVKLGGLEGAWEQTGVENQTFIRFTDGMMIAWSQSQMVISRVAACAPGELTLKRSGATGKAHYEIKGGEVTLTMSDNPGEKMVLKPLKEVPPQVSLDPLKLGAAGPVAEDKVKEIQDEFAKRKVTDQSIRSKLMSGRATRDDLVEQKKIDAENTAYVKKLIAEVGWIDGQRFGKEASNTAFLIVQHSGDLRLMLTALPEIEKDVKTGQADGQGFALLFDRTQIMLGQPQRYGTQLTRTNKGQMQMLPLEDRSKVDEFRQSLHMQPLADYLQHFHVTLEQVEFLKDD